MTGAAMPATPTVVVVGSINMDMVAHAQRLPLPGETLQGSAFAMEPGGKGANQAVAAARLGAAVSFVARVGTRDHGIALIEALHRHGVDTRALVQDAQALPGIAVIMVAQDGGENAIVYVPGSNADLRPDDVRAASATIAAARVVVAQLEVPQPAILEAFRLARTAGARTLLNAAPALPVQPELLALTDVLVLNESEAALMAGLAQEEASQVDAQLLAERAAPRLLQTGVGQLLVTLGARGVLVAEAGRQRLMATQAVKAVDTVGAGDTFVGGLACGLAEGRDLDEAIALGQAAAAIAVSRSGVQDAMPRRAELGEDWAAGGSKA